MTLRAVAEKYFEALNSERYSVVGRPAALAYFPALLANYAAHEDRVTRWIESAAAVTTEIDFTGRLRDGRPVAFSALGVFDLRDGVIAKVTTWYDTHDLRRQLRRPGRAASFRHWRGGLGSGHRVLPRAGRKAAHRTMHARCRGRRALDDHGRRAARFSGRQRRRAVQVRARGAGMVCATGSRRPSAAPRYPRRGCRRRARPCRSGRRDAALGKPGFFGPVRVAYLSGPDGTVLELLDGSLGAIAGVVRD